MHVAGSKEGAPVGEAEPRRSANVLVFACMCLVIQVQSVEDHNHHDFVTAGITVLRTQWKAVVLELICKITMKLCVGYSQNPFCL